MVDRCSSDGQLIQRYRDGDENAFEILYERYRRQLYAYLNRQLPGQPAVVDDLYQKTWLRILDNLHRYRDRQKFLSWAFRIAHNLAVDHFRRDGRRQELPVDERIPSKRKIPREQADMGDLRQVLEQAVQELPHLQKEVFLLRQQDIPFKDIAAIQKVSINTALGRMHYAVRRLRERLREYAP